MKDGKEGQDTLAPFSPGVVVFRACGRRGERRRENERVRKKNVSPRPFSPSGGCGLVRGGEKRRLSGSRNNNNNNNNNNDMCPLVHSHPSVGRRGLVAVARRGGEKRETVSQKEKCVPSSVFTKCRAARACGRREERRREKGDSQRERTKKWLCPSSIFTQVSGGAGLWPS